MRLARIHPSARRAGRCSIGPVIEALEPRRCLSAALHDGLLICHGTGGNDYLFVTVNGYDSTKLAVLDGDSVVQFDRAAVKGVVMYGGDGNDWLGAQTGCNFDIPMTLFGGAGDDTLLGGAADDSLIGGEGEDFLDGRSIGSDPWVPNTDAPSILVGRDTLVHADGSDTLLGEAAGGADEFHGEIAYNESFAYHNRVVRITLPVDCHEFMLLRYYCPVVDVNHGYYTCGHGIPVAFDVYLSKRMSHEEFDSVASEYGAPVTYHFYEDGERPGMPQAPQPVSGGENADTSAAQNPTGALLPLPSVFNNTSTIKRAWEALDGGPDAS
jgi:Ca2+-binding RTX toxin-like protein